MNTLETLTSRKSIRSYTGQQISSDELALLLKAANAAPVGMGQYDGLPGDFVPSCAVALGKTDEKYTIREIPTNRIVTKTIV